jgi:hypothetical protein
MIKLSPDTIWALCLPTLATTKILAYARAYFDEEIWYGRGALWTPDPTGWRLLAEVST